MMAKSYQSQLVLQQDQRMQFSLKK